MLIPGKQFKILNSKIKTLLQVVADTGGEHYVSGVEVQYMMKPQESHVRDLMEGIEKKLAEVVDFHSKSYDYEV